MRIRTVLRYPEKEIDGSEALIRERTGNRSLVLFDSGDEVTVQAGEEGIRFLLVSRKPLQEPVADGDEHAGPVATGDPRASGRDLHRERLSRMRCCNCIAAVALPRPTKSRNRCGRASILFVAFRPSRVEHPPRNTGGSGPRGQEARRACRVRRSNARERLPDCQFVRPRCRRQSYLVALTSHWCCAPDTTLIPKFCDQTRCRIRGPKKRELSRFKSLIFPWIFPAGIEKIPCSRT